MIKTTYNALPPSARGFTLVETLVAITILVLATVGPLYAVHKSLAASYAARDKLVASALAQEGVEYVHSIRDDNYLANTISNAGRSWLAGVDGTSNGSNNADCFAPKSCTIDESQTSSNVLGCGSGGCLPLRLSPANVYTQVINAAYPVTKFTRSVQIRSVSATEVTVSVTVSWATLTVPYTITVTEHLYNWL